MNGQNTVERIRKVYKDKVMAFNKFSNGKINKELVEQEKRDEDYLKNVVNPSVSEEDLRAKRQNKFDNLFIKKHNSELLKGLAEHQNRVRCSGRGMEIDNM